MKDKQVRRLIMQNLPTTIDGQASKIYLKIAVQQDALSLGDTVSDQQFREMLYELNRHQMLIVFEDGFVKPTTAGLRGYKAT